MQKTGPHEVLGMCEVSCLSGKSGIYAYVMWKDYKLGFQTFSLRIC